MLRSSSVRQKIYTLSQMSLSDVWGYGLITVEYLKKHTCTVPYISQTVIWLDFL